MWGVGSLTGGGELYLSVGPLHPLCPPHPSPSHPWALGAGTPHLLAATLGPLGEVENEHGFWSGSLGLTAGRVMLGRLIPGNFRFLILKMGDWTAGKS